MHRVTAKLASGSTTKTVERERADSSPTIDCESLADHRPSRVAGTRVLIIDDDPSFRDLMGLCLRKAGYEPILAADGEQGLAIAAKTRPDAIIVDAALPGIDGIGVLHRIRLDAGLHRTPCLMLTGSDAREDELRALDAGADAYVRKSERMSVVMARLRAVIRATSGPSLADSSTSILSPKRVLIIEEPEIGCELPLLALRKCGYQIHSVENIDAAFERLRTEAADCLLAVLKDADREAAAFCHRLKNSALSRDIPLMVLLGDERASSMITLLNAGADDCLPWSCHTSMLQARLGAQIRRKQQEDVARSIQQELLLREKEAQAAQAMAQARAAHLAELEQKNAELQAMNEELERARQQAKSESQYKSKFLASMSHELRTPLNAIIGFSELLEQEIGGPLTPTQADYVQNVLSSGRHLLTLINDVLDLSKIEAGMMTLHREWSAIPPLVDAVIKVVKPLAEKRGVRLEAKLGETLPEVYVDIVRIKQVLYNLLSNAIKFTDKDGLVSVEAQELDGHVAITVRDTGIGIDPADLPLLFREFVQIDDAQGDRPAGTGLGLPLTRNLVELHGGRMEVQSKPGEGSAFTFYLPHLKREADGLATKTPAAQVDENAETPQDALALVCDDDPKSAELIAAQLRALGLGVVFAHSAQEAVRLAYERRPAVITLDVSLPQFDGYAVLARLKALPETAVIPVVVVSVIDSPSHAMNRGAADYLVKPVRRDKLATSLEVIGVRLRRLDDMVVLVAGPQSNELETIAGHLRHAGAQVTRVASVDADAIRAAAGFDMVVLDLWSPTAPGAVAEAAQTAEEQALPVLGVTLAAPTPTAYPGVTLIQRESALQADVLIRTAYRIVETHRYNLGATRSLNEARARVLEHLEAAIERTAQHGKHLSVIGLKILPPPEVAPGEIHELLRSDLRTADLVFPLGPHTAICIAHDIEPAQVRTMLERIAVLTQRNLGAESVRTGVAHYPTDAASATRLIDQVIRHLEKGSHP